MSSGKSYHPHRLDQRINTPLLAIKRFFSDCRSAHECFNSLRSTVLRQTAFSSKTRAFI